jgi:hypothetical protein
MFAAIVPVPQRTAACQALESQGFGPNAFRVPLYDGTDTRPTHAGLHVWNEPAFISAVKALSGVLWSEVAGGPSDRFHDALSKAGAQWGEDFPLLAGQVTPGEYCMTEDGDVLYIIQPFDADVYPDPPPALVRKVRTPGVVGEYVQPIDQYDAYQQHEPFTGLPERVTFNGVVYEAAADNIVHSPGSWPAGWSEVA